MTSFRQWAESHQLGDLPDVVYRYAEAAWQAAQAAERERAKELLMAAKGLLALEDADLYSEEDGCHEIQQARAAIAKYEGRNDF